jgi:membrane protease YdiL (CAAX protease family)
MTARRLWSGPAGRLLGFVAGATAAIAASIPAATFAGGLLGVSRPAVWMALASGFISALLLILSAWLLRREGASLSTLGLPTDAFRMRELGVGFLITTVLFLAVAGTQSAAVGASWHFQGARGVMQALAGFVAAASMVLAEELLFRGMALRYLRVLCGDGAAISLTALLFGAYHLIGSGDWGMGAVFRFVMPVIGGLLFGWAAVRSLGLALPIGLHLGGNWVQSSVAGFAPSAQPAGADEVQALWRIPISAGDMQLLAAPDLLPRLPYVAAIGVAAMVTWMFLRSRQVATRP